jgi:hypothetical protein
MVGQKSMPTERQILYSLLRFGAATPDEKTQTMLEYLETSTKLGGGPHVWNPDVEIIESLYSMPRRLAESEEVAEGLKVIEYLAARLLDEQSTIVDRSAYRSPLGGALQSKCIEALATLGPEKEQPLPFFELMCQTCD